jgi:hypothetical protein
VQVHRLAANQQQQQQQRSGQHTANTTQAPAPDAAMCALLQQLAVLRSIAGDVYAANSSAGTAAAAAAADGSGAGTSANACRAAAAASSTLKLLDGQLLQLALGKPDADIAFAFAAMICGAVSGVYTLVVLAKVHCTRHHLMGHACSLQPTFSLLL